MCEEHKWEIILNGVWYFMAGFIVGMVVTIEFSGAAEYARPVNPSVIKAPRVTTPLVVRNYRGDLMFPMESSCNGKPCHGPSPRPKK